MKRGGSQLRRTERCRFFRNIGGRRRRRRRSGVVLLIAFALISCATLRGRPSWITEPPAGTDTVVYFVSAGSDAGGDVAEAEAQASRALAGEITKYMGVSISADTTVEVRATIDDYEARVTETIRERSQAKISGFRIVDRHIETTPDGTVFVYLLGGYDRGELEAEKARLEALFAEKVAAIGVPEREADELLDAGEPVRALERYLAAAAAALDSDIDNAMVRFERVIAGAREAASMVRIEKRTAYQVTTVGRPFREPFVVAVSRVADGRPLAQVPLRVTYRAARSGGRLAVRTAGLTTESDGTAAFEHPVPRIAGERELIVSLDVSGLLDPLGAARGKAFDLVASVESVVNARRVAFAYRVVAESASIPTAVAVADFDENGVAGDSNRAGEALAGELSKAGYEVAVVPADPEETVESLEKRLGERYRRVVTGGARVIGIEESDGGYLARVESTVSVIDLETGSTVGVANATKTIRARSREGISEAAFSAIGAAIGAKLAAELP